jgi:hypothetical protein
VYNLAAVLQQLGAHLVTALTRLNVYNLARTISLEAGSTRDKMGGKDRRKVCQFGTGNIKKRRRARVYPERKNLVGIFPAFRDVGAVQSALGVGRCGREISALATYPLKFAKVGSAVALLQQKKRNSIDVQRARVNITGFICTEPKNS